MSIKIIIAMLATVMVTSAAAGTYTAFNAEATVHPCEFYEPDPQSIPPPAFCHNWRGQHIPCKNFIV